jgi:hypothetical protein
MHLLWLAPFFGAAMCASGPDQPKKSRTCALSSKKDDTGRRDDCAAVINGTCGCDDAYVCFADCYSDQKEEGSSAILHFPALFYIGNPYVMTAQESAE